MRDGLSTSSTRRLRSLPARTEVAVSELGIADRGLVFDFVRDRAEGRCRRALDQMEALCSGGADPLSVIQDLLDLRAFRDPGSSWCPMPGWATSMEAGDRDRACSACRAPQEPGAGARLADAVEGHRGARRDRPVRQAGGRDAAGRPRLRRRLAGPGRAGEGACQWRARWRSRQADGRHARRHLPGRNDDRTGFC